MRNLLQSVNEEKMSAEDTISLFLELFALLAGHFQLREGLADELDTFVGFGNSHEQLARKLAEDYELALEDEKQGDKSFVAGLPSIIQSPKVKKAILEDE